MTECLNFVNGNNDLRCLRLKKLNALVGGYVNLAYPLPSGASVKFLNDQTTYLGNQLESEFGGDRCFGNISQHGFYHGIVIC